MAGMNATQRRMCLLTDGFLDVFTAKTAVGLLRYCPTEIVAVLDKPNAGKKLEEIVATGAGVPIVDSIAAATRLHANQLVLGAAFPGGQVPAPWRQHIREALAAGMDIVNGLHQRLNEDAELAAAAKAAGKRIWDVRNPPALTKVGTCKARTTKGKRILTIGTDCNLGKRVMALELTREMKQRGLNAEFVPTGQTGVMTVGRGVALDAVVSDFVSGAIEEQVLAVGDADYILVEGQGALVHPGFSAVTLGLMHGSLPDEMILCHAPARKTMRSSSTPVISMGEMITLSEAILRPLHHSKVVGVALNCHGMNDDDAAKARDEAHAVTGLPVVDAFKTGVGPLVDVISRR
jgi:uncharacterized NAD-dependent epimerase/dehydratase family protein